MSGERSTALVVFLFLVSSSLALYHCYYVGKPLILLRKWTEFAFETPSKSALGDVDGPPTRL